MHAQVVAVDVSSNRHSLEAFNEQLVNLFFSELGQDLLTEREVLCHGTTFVIPSQHDNLFREVDLEAVQEHQHFQRENTSINIVTKEEQVSIGQSSWVNNFFEHVDHVVELAVNVTNNDNRLLNFEHVRFCLKDLSHLTEKLKKTFFGDRPFQKQVFSDQVHVGQRLATD